MKNRYKIALIFLTAVFIYFRLMPVINHTVPYTYDQGRDFLKTQEMIENMRPTFIGPTTGIMGLFHGAWRYYLLLIPRILFNGVPIGFYYFMLFLSINGNLAFFFFIRKKTNDLAALLFMSFVSISPYFIPLGFSVSNNIIVPYLVLMLIFLVTSLFEKKTRPFLYFALGLTLAFIFEFEVAFGLFMIPAFFLTAVFFRETRKKIYKIKNLFLVFCGMIIPVLPRVLFEIKNNFLQTKTVIGFFTAPKLHNPKPVNLVFMDRIGLFFTYAKGLVYANSVFLLVAVFLAAIIFIIVYKKTNKMSPIIHFLVTLVLVLFGFSLLYKDNFWFNYYEGIQYIFLIIFVFSFSTFATKKTFLSGFILIFFIALNLLAVVKDIRNPDAKKLVGLAEAEATFDYIHEQTGKDDYCTRIYTPPVIPHTYVYLMNLRSRLYGYRISTYDYQKNTCYYIIESDRYDFRIKKWREENTPKNAVMTSKKILTDNVKVETWALK